MAATTLLAGRLFSKKGATPGEKATCRHTTCMYLLVIAISAEIVDDVSSCIYSSR